ncbi:hypothetical protein GPALN_007503 [Globodera pallida]|nr:hypothetical protein GPALN_007503 [Globodera pallida]
MGIFRTKLINQFSPMVVRYIDLMEHSISQSIEKNFFREKDGCSTSEDVFWKLDALQAFIQDLNWPEEEFAKYLQVRMRTLAAEIISNCANCTYQCFDQHMQRSKKSMDYVFPAELCVMVNVVFCCLMPCQQTDQRRRRRWPRQWHNHQRQQQQQRFPPVQPVKKKIYCEFELHGIDEERLNNKCYQSIQRRLNVETSSVEMSSVETSSGEMYCSLPAHMRDFDKITIRRVENEVAAFFQQLRTTFSGLGVVINTHSNKHSSWQQSDYAQQHWAAAPDMRSPSYGVQADFLVEKAPNTAEKCNGIVIKISETDG